MKLHHLHVAQLRPGLVGHRRPVPGALPRVRGDPIHLPRAAAREHEGTAPIQDEAAIRTTVGERSGDPAAGLEQPDDGGLHVNLHALGVHRAVLERPDQLQPGAVADMGQARVRVGAERTLMDSSLPRAVEHRAPSLELEHSLGRFLGVQLRHLPVVDELAALHRVGEVDLPRVLVGDVVHRGRHAALGHYGVRLTQQ